MEIKVKEPKETNPKDLCIIGLPKSGKSAILADLSLKENCVIFDLEKGGYDYLKSRSVSIYESDTDTIFDAYKRYLSIRDSLLKLPDKDKPTILAIDSITELDALSEIGGTYLYMNSIVGKNFNRSSSTGKKLDYGDPEWTPVTAIGEGYGYQYTRQWFLDQIELFKQIAPYRIYVGHITDKYIINETRETIIGEDIALTGKLKFIVPSRMTAIAKIVPSKTERYLNFEVSEKFALGGRLHRLKGKILISKEVNEKIETFWNNIYKF